MPGRICRGDRGANLTGFVGTHESSSLDLANILLL